MQGVDENRRLGADAIQFGKDNNGKIIITFPCEMTSSGLSTRITVDGLDVKTKNFFKGLRSKRRFILQKLIIKIVDALYSDINKRMEESKKTPSLKLGDIVPEGYVVKYKYMSGCVTWINCICVEGEKIDIIGDHCDKFRIQWIKTYEQVIKDALQQDKTKAKLFVGSVI